MIIKPPCPLLGVLGLDALHQVPAELGGRVHVGEDPEDGPDAVADLVLGVAHLVDEEGQEGDGLHVVQVVAVLGEHGEHL